MSADAPATRFTWRSGLRIVGSLGAIALVLSIVDREAVLTGLRRTPVEAFLVALGGFLGLHALSALKWRSFLVLAGAELSTLTALRAYAAGLFANLCLPSLVGGDFVRAGVLVTQGASLADVAVGGVADRLSDLLALALLVAMATGFAQGALRAEGLAFGPWVALLPLVMIAGLAVGLFVLRRLPLRRLPRKLRRLLIRLERAWRRLRARPTRALLGLLASTALQAGFVLVNVYLGRAIGLVIATKLWFLLWPLAKLAAMAPVSLGGIGLREAAFAALVAPFGDEATAVAQSLVWEAVLVVGGLVAGLCFLVTRSRR
ncbi:MAG: flippase-like domain-containing protein [Planctomycetes bacterium]|nr:flippase-like domain-containing protein [Planctomycetota bacterium]